MKPRLKPLQIPIKDFLNKMEECGIVPNFYMSQAYLSVFSDIKCFTKNGFYWCEDNDWILFPPFHESGTTKTFYIHKPVWCDYESEWSLSSRNNEVRLKFLDYEYIYDPKNFLNLKGGKWETFRKNSRKWKKNNPDYSYILDVDDSELPELLLSWLVERENTVEDEMVFYHLCFFSKHSVKKYLTNGSGELIGVNIYDFNHHYINYRICLTKPGERYANEFLRYLFYTDHLIINSNKLVNDGGCLGIPSLEKFKDKLNPISKKPRYSITLI